MPEQDDSQERIPILEALQKHQAQDVAPFHVPGHKHGKGSPVLTDYFGARMLEADLNAMSDIDDLGNPVGVIKEAQDLAARAFGAESAHMLINGTTSGIHTMILAAAGKRDKIIVPRNGHKSMYSALILSGASPIFIPPSLHPEFGFPLPPNPRDVQEIFSEVRKIPSVRIAALFAINPSYFGLSPRLAELARIAHEEDVSLLVDEAHGAHFYFNSAFPESAMKAGADMSAVSLHKTGGSLTQSSLLLRNGKRITNEVVRNVLDLLRSSSASYLLMSSIDCARSQLAIRGAEMLEKTLALARDARKEINGIPGLHSPGPAELLDDTHTGGFDETRLTVFVRDLGISGFQAERYLRNECNVQIELSDFHSVVAIVSLGDTKENLDRLVAALRSLSNSGSGGGARMEFPDHPAVPPRVMNPRDAFYSRKELIPIAESTGTICAEMIMAYPPGIPVICPGEVLTDDIIDHVLALRKAGAAIQGLADTTATNVQIVEGS